MLFENWDKDFSARCRRFFCIIQNRTKNIGEMGYNSLCNNQATGRMSKELGLDSGVADFSLLQNIWASSSAHPASNSMGTGGSCHGKSGMGLPLTST
jgi:hypothetical protein